MSRHQRVILTGAGGFIGQELLRVLSERGYEVTALSRTDGSTPRSATGIKRLQADLSKRDDMNRLRNLLEPHEVFIHAAGRAHVEPSSAANASYYDDNVIATENSLDLARSVGAKRFIHLSTVAVGDKDPWNGYVSTKRQAEKKVASYCREAGMSYTIVRPYMVYGEGDQKGHFIPLFEQIRKGWLPLVDRGMAVKPVLYVRNLSSWLLRILEDEREGADRIFVLFDRDPLTIRQLAELIRYGTGGSCLLIPIPAWVSTLLEILLRLTSAKWEARVKKLRDDGRPMPDLHQMEEGVVPAHPDWMPYSTSEGVRRTSAWLLEVRNKTRSYDRLR